MVVGSRQIATQIEASIREGVYPPGAVVPSVRSLAESFDVSPSTAASALAELRRRGLIVTHARRQSRVSPRPPVSLRRQSRVPSGVRDLASGNPDPALLPALDVAVRRMRMPTRSYGADPVIPELVDMARDEFAEAGVHAESVCLTSGALDAVERVLAAHLRPGDRVAVEDPCYAALLDLLRSMDLEPVPAAVDDLGMLPDALGASLASSANAVVLTPRAQNPTGAALDPARAADLADVLARRPDVLVVEDDHQGPLSGAPGVSVVRECRQWARIRSVTKALGPDLRLAFVTGDATTLARVEGRLAVGPGWVSELLQRVVAALMGSDEVRHGLVRATATYRERRESLLARLAERGIEAHGRSGLNVWAPVPDETAAVTGLIGRGWMVAPGAPYRLDARPAVRVTTATLSPADAARFASDLAETLAGPPPRRLV